MSARQNPGKILLELRLRTQLAHARLEAGSQLLDEMLEIESYRGVIQKFYGFWKTWEPAIGLLLNDEVFFQPRKRLSLLHADLVTLGLSQNTIRKLATCPPVKLQMQSEALGSLYVMEGSTLGGRIIQKHVERRLNLTANSGCQYFAGYGQNTGEMWRLFLQRLETLPETASDAVVNGALTTFADLQHWLSV